MQTFETRHRPQNTPAGNENRLLAAIPHIPWVCPARPTIVVTTPPALAFTTLKEIAQHQQTVKDSVFIAYASRVDTPEQALHYLRTVLTQHRDASHLCWAYRIGNQYRFSDAGEPGGTAGQPILRAIEGQGLDHVVVGVVRYFGGTKLGAGGLVRAYGGVAAEALRTSQRLHELPRQTLTLGVPFEHINSLYRLLDTMLATRLQEQYDENGLSISVSVTLDQIDELESALRDATRGQFTLVKQTNPKQ